MALGLLTPVGGIAAWGPMLMAWIKVHSGKPIWVTEGGAELPLTNIAVATAIALVGPGRYSLDEALDIEVPTPLIALTAAGVATGMGFALLSQPTSEEQAEQAGGELQAGEGAGEQGIDTALGSS
jgi:putative oxidoreductase